MIRTQLKIIPLITLLSVILTLIPYGEILEEFKNEHGFKLQVTQSSIIRERDSLALVELYLAADGPNWKNKWDLSQSMNTWYGVNSTSALSEVQPEKGFVYSLLLGNNNLKGSIPIEIGQLEGLQILNLEYNLLMGTIPATIQSLIHLERLQLNNNLLSGSIPSEIGQLDSLSYLQLSYNQLTQSIPSALGSLPNLRSLFLNNNLLSGDLPPTLGELNNLLQIDVSTNQLEGCFPTTYQSICQIEQQESGFYRFFNNPNLPDNGDFSSFCLDNSGACPDQNCSMSDWLEILQQKWFIDLENDSGVLLSRYCDRELHFELISDESKTILKIIVDNGTTDYFTCEGLLLATCNSVGCSPKEFDPVLFGNVRSSSIADKAVALKGPKGDVCQPIDVSQCLNQNEFQTPPNGGVARTSNNHLDVKNYVPNELLVRCNTNVPSQQLQSLKEALQVSSIKKLRYQNIEVWTIDTKVTDDLPSLCKKYAGHPAIHIIEPNYIYRASQVPNEVYDPSFEKQWGLHNIGQSNGMIDADIDAVEGWPIQQSSPNVRIAIIDSGIAFTHPDLINNIWQNSGEDLDGDGVLVFMNGCWMFDPDDINGIDDDGNGYADDFVGWDFRNNDNNPFDNAGHGTHIAGIIGAEGYNGIGIHGVSNKVQLVPLKFLNDDPEGPYGSVADALEAIGYAIQMEIPISNNSWSGEHSEILKGTLEAAKMANHLFVTGAGNDAQNIDSLKTYPAAYDLDNIIVVAGTDRNDQIYRSSNVSVTHVDIAAPAKDIYSCLPGGEYGFKSGTSMATAFVTGCAALILEHSSAKNYQVIKEAILNSVDTLSTLDGFVKNKGRLNLANALNSSSFSCRYTDSLVLAEIIYEEVIGLPWDLSTPITEWSGVSLNEQGCVSQLLLNDLGLSGNIPAGISALNNLSVLDLSGNSMTGIIPASIGKLVHLSRLSLNNNQLTGLLPPTLKKLSSLTQLDLSFNNLIGCFPKGFELFCETDASFSDNLVLEDFMTFCTMGTSVCRDTIYPGDFNNDGIANTFDLIVWGLLEGSTGTKRIEAGIQWKSYIGTPDWENRINTTNPINAKYSDANGDGVVDERDALVLEQNYGFTQPGFKGISSTNEEKEINVKLTNPVRIESGIAIEIHLEDTAGEPIAVHGFSGTIDLSSFDLPSTIKLDTVGSSLEPAYHISKYNVSTKTLEVGITRKDKKDKLCIGPVGFVVIADALGIGEEVVAKVDKGRIAASGSFEVINGSDLYYTLPGEIVANSTRLDSWLSVTHEACGQLGTIEVNLVNGIPPFTIAYTNEIDLDVASFDTKNYTLNDLPAGTYQITIKDAEEAKKTFDVIIDKQCLTTHTLEITESATEAFNLSLAPNPFQSTSTISYTLPSSGLVNINLFDMQGKMRKTIIENEFQINGEHVISFTEEDLESGMYFLKFQKDEGFAVKKVFVVN